MRVAVLGTGRMGGAMAGTLSRAGVDLVVWNRSSGRAKEVAGSTQAEVVLGAPEAVAGADVVISSLADDAAVLDVYTGRYGAVSGMHEGQVVLEMSTIAPHTVRQIYPAVEAQGAAFLDSPVSGSVATVESGQLTIMVGGEQAALDRARPVLDALAKNVLHVGSVGAGATMKLAINALVHAIDVGLSEALVLAEKAGVERTDAYEVFATGATAAPFVLYKREAFEKPDEAPMAFSLDLMAKDLDLILELAAEVGLSMDQARTNRKTVRAALEAGFSGRDLSAVAEFLRRGS
jgi:3-hydroxyisobutyrate dehydrogenase-like beta-hydroxyacid dehydrogenase